MTSRLLFTILISIVSALTVHGQEAAPCPCSLESLVERGAVVTTNADGTVKALDLTRLSSVHLTGAFSEADRRALRALRVVRGKGLLELPLLEAVFQAPALTELLWTETKLPAEFVSATSSTSFKSLKKLRMTELDEANVQAVLNLTLRMPELVELDLSRSVLTDRSVAEWGFRDHLRKLTRLNLYQTRITDAGIRDLAGLANQLLWLNLDATSLTDAGIPELIHFTKLEFLHLGRTAITDASVASLAKLTGLKTLHVTRTQMTEEGMNRLQKALPKCEVITVVKP